MTQLNFGPNKDLRPLNFKEVIFLIFNQKQLKLN